MIVSVCEATSGMKRNAVGSCVRLKKWKGEGLDNRSIRLHLGTLRGFSSALILLHAILFFFQMRKAEHVTYNLEKKVYNVYNVISQI